MIVEERIYRIRSGKTSEYLKLVREEGLAIQEPILGGLIGYFVTEVGQLNQVVHLWRYADFADRVARRRTLSEDVRWRAFILKLTALIESAENRILLPTDFSPLQ
ncbi:MAG: NIPSNAP family protein [Mesorhizobium sp.]|uniref:NIPSNAP family protein n=1 Tax=Mesorhizobium sp. TaxID=1871066 RepID=UPI000FE660A7|nr:NIPSNAP family protein [Mesorhizobium sp.]RWB31623.1 MAG: NIPSNAP family protein [Mesorhizobium sp.]RWD37198.1 MAG: NIPSNAP family protein [Mesorhizobium sp.]RWD46660.1 MAG: NIPSNAP family protein [Mesorhizobium sp.]RWD78570.1 MAG: NIPSNAP family protein [Mesorhizobium sp.]RWF00328.1 MAG: NIPSNAP family protein [Mesorhizobium sp.]